MNDALENLLRELLNDKNTKDKLSALSEKAQDPTENSVESLQDKYSRLDKKIQLLNALCPVLGENFTAKAQKVIRALQAIKAVSELEKSP